MPSSPSLGGLPDYLASGLTILFVGINPGIRSAAVGHHFAGSSNRFWKLLFEARLIPYPLKFEDDWRLPELGIGLTNLIARPTVGVQDLNTRDFLDGRQALLAKIRRYQPRLVALLGITMARILLFPEKPEFRRRKTGGDSIQVGPQSLSLAGRPVCVLPNPSGRNAHYSYQAMKELFGALNEWSNHDERGWPASRLFAIPNIHTDSSCTPDTGPFRVERENSS